MSHKLKRYFVALACTGCVAAAGFGQKLLIDPPDGLADEALQIKVTGLHPGQPVIIRASTRDGNDKIWQSFAGFYANSRGEVDASSQAPANGTYSGVDAMGLFTSMDLPNPDHDRARFIYSRTEPVKFDLSLEIDGKTIAKTEVTRRFMHSDTKMADTKMAGTKMADVRENKLVGTLFTPAGKGDFPAVLVLGGSEGGLSSEDVAALLSSHGYVALSLAYFGAEGLPPDLENIPLEYFRQALDWLKMQPGVKKDSMAVFGTSKGSEAALILAAKYPDIHAVVAYAPSSVVWSCICNTAGNSSWSFAGKPIPFVPQGTDPTYRPPAGFPISPRINYDHRLQNKEAVRQAAIPVEKINGPVLLIAGKDDELWNSFAMSQMIMRRLKRYKHRFPDRLLAYPSAGHLIGKSFLPAGSTLIAGGRLSTGGTPQGNANAQKDAWAKVLIFLNRSQNPKR